MSGDIAKFNAAQAALDYVKDGMVIGLGTGSTSAHFVRQLGERVRQGLRVKGVPKDEIAGRVDEAIQEFEEALRRKPGYQPAQIGLERAKARKAGSGK